MLKNAILNRRLAARAGLLFTERLLIRFLSIARKRAIHPAGVEFSFAASLYSTGGRNKRLAVIRNAATERDPTETKCTEESHRKKEDERERREGGKKTEREGIFQERNLICPEVCHGTRIDSRALEPRRASKRRRVPQSDAIEVPPLLSSSCDN